MTLLCLPSQTPGYYDIVAEDMSVWHVPNNFPLLHWNLGAILRYHTNNRFLRLYGGNLFELFKVTLYFLCVFSANI